MMELSLTVPEAQQLADHEAVIERGLKTFVEVGTSLAAIRDSRLYREAYSTFEDYCRERWGMERRNAYQLIEAAEVVENVRHGAQILPANERQARPLTSLSPDEQRQAWLLAVETAPHGRITAAHVQSVVDDMRADVDDEPESTYEFDYQEARAANSAGFAVAYPEPKRPVSYHVSDDSYDWYTPAEYIEAARGVMGSIDVDPASSPMANEVVRATRYYTKEDDGLAQPWAGNVWINPPYNMPLIEQFIDRAVSDYKAGEIDAAIILTNNSTDTGWFHKLVNYPFCLTKGRIRFWNGDEVLATRQGQAIFYLGDNPDLFAKVFSTFGVVVRRYDN